MNGIGITADPPVVKKIAPVNRSTFYAHFPDKYALLATFAREQFQLVVASKLPPAARWGRASLRLLIQALFDYYQVITSRCPSSMKTMDSFLKQTVHEQLTEILLIWLEQEQVSQRVAAETMAAVVGWSILGAVVHWVEGPKTLTAEQITDQVLIVITEGMERLT